MRSNAAITQTSLKTKRVFVYSLEDIQRQQLMAEQKRLEEERQERERRRHQNEIEQIKHRHLQEKLQQVNGPLISQ